MKGGLTAVTPFLAVPDIPAAIDFYVRVFGAVDVRRDADPIGAVQHAVISIDGAPLELGRHAVTKSAPGELPSVSVHLYVPDVDAVYSRAIAAGATGRPPADMPYADREAGVFDPFGITWWVATNKSAAK